MRKIKRTLFIILSGVFILFIIQQSYYRIAYEGNLVFYISNESFVDFATIEIYIDGEKVLEDKVTNQGTHLYKPYSLKTTLGNHAIVLKINGETAEEIKINTFLVTFISVDYYGDRLDVPDMVNPHFNIGIRKTPMFFIA